MFYVMDMNKSLEDQMEELDCIDNFLIMSKCLTIYDSYIDTKINRITNSG